MEQRGVVLRSIARVLNAGGSALVTVYDAAASLKTIVLPGEEGTFTAQLKEYETKLGRLYSEIGKEVVLRTTAAGETTQLSAAGEAGIKQAVEYQAEIATIRQRMQKSEAEEKAAPERAAGRVKMAPEPLSQSIADAEELAVPLPAAEETKEVDAEITAAPEMAADGAAPEVAAEPADNRPEESTEFLGEEAATPAPETAGTEPAAALPLEELLKSDLLQICSERGIEADKKMTKAEIIALISGN